MTKQSSLSKLTPWNALMVLLATAGVVILLNSCILVVLMGIDFLTQRLRSQEFMLALAQFIPAITLSVTVLMLVDNFSYTLFKFGVVSTQGVWRLAYAVGFSLMLGYVWWRGWKAAHARSKLGGNLRHWSAGLAIVLAATSVTALIYGMVTSRQYYGQLLETYTMPAARTPNIILIGGDGLSTSHLSVYSYERDTTPFLRQLAGSSLVGNNHFTNASSTTASTTTILTGREPIKVDVMRYPDILEGEDAYNHLPGILKQYGYTTIEVGVTKWVDARVVNLLNGFDSVNGQPLDPPLLNTLRRYLGDSQVPYFLWTTAQRALARIQHIFFIQEMENPIEAVMDPKARMSDQERVDTILSMLDQSRQPVYMIAHFMGTHGPEFSFQDQVYSKGDMKDNPWNVNFYDDAIAGFDGYVEQIYKHLEERDMLDNTILIIYSDHGLRYVTNVQIPLIMHFPEGEFAGVFNHNSANMDIPVTLLDYMGLPKPDWMDGISLVSDDLPASRPIFSIRSGSPKKVVAPFYQIKTVQVIVCQRWYQLNVQENQSKSGTFPEYASECDAEQEPTDKEIHELIIQYLSQHGYEVDSLYP
ncbi:MAG: sulfatase-like hydrolase/transferase [Chloroflexota bacterium]|nr:sulfatase-like hydrolase/transferase [Chloroflexota bacterium]